MLSTDEAADALVMNDRWFFGLLDRMTADVRRQPAGAQRDELLAKLAAVGEAAVRRSGAA